ncbi:efflux RND transporter periplasmic adaptor subunit [Streptosporangium sp. NPDC002721]|uniref:efflux RND transporter periplasmic adaptor subunit n=1 Tax=Streptosporangium sp. NPDC002721 TaxID=3366188 RepID=UPI0036855088
MRPTHLPKNLRAGGLALAALVLVGAGAIVMFDGGSEQAPRVEPASARRGTVTAAVSAAGSTVDDGTRDLAFGGSGTVTRVYVKAGDRVGKGDVLARIGSAPARERHDAAKAQLAAAEEALETAESTPEGTGTTEVGQQTGAQDGSRTANQVPDQATDRTADQAGADRSGADRTGADGTGDRTGDQTDRADRADRAGEQTDPDRPGSAARTGCEPTATRPPGAGATPTPAPAGTDTPTRTPEPARTLSPPSTSTPTGSTRVLSPAPAPAPIGSARTLPTSPASQVSPASASAGSARTVQVVPAGGIVPAGYRFAAAPVLSPAPTSTPVPARSQASLTATPAPTATPAAVRADDGSPQPAPTVTVTVTATATVTVTARPHGGEPPATADPGPTRPPSGPSIGPSEHPGPTGGPTGTARPTATAEPTGTTCPTPKPSASAGTDKGTSPNRNTGQNTQRVPQQDGGAGRGALTVEQAEDRVKQARAELTDASEELAGVRIVAPADGTVMSVAGAVGDSAGTGTFLTLGNLDELQVEALFTESDIGSLKPGQRAAITLATRRGERYTGTVTGIDPTATTSDRLVRYGVTIAFDEPPANLLVGQTASVTVTVAESAETLYVPVQAVRTRDGVSRVTVQGGAERVVETGVRGDQYVEITSGLSENDRVVLPGGATGGEFPDSSWPEPGTGTP